MSNTNTSGPAFPVRPELCQDLSVEEQRGMTLRDYFAGQALQGMLFVITDWNEAKVIAEYAYKHADAMLKARDA